ncbi:MAG: type II 3-dehydroquinate dehydratase [Clostridiales bacterium]|nr:type II 3-dehydroquinate dehydratase [Clostridiales bacterium]
MKVLVINGPNLNMLGTREKEIYGNNDYKILVALIKKSAKERGISVKCIQTNYEGDIVTAIQKAIDKFDGIIINAGAYTHTSIAILDALKAVQIPTVEVHISKLKEREDFRQLSYISLYAFKTIIGKGFDGYIDALDELLHLGD